MESWMQHLGFLLLLFWVFFWICLYFSCHDRYRCAVYWQRGTWFFFTTDLSPLAPHQREAVRDAWNSGFGDQKHQGMVGFLPRSQRWTSIGISLEPMWRLGHNSKVHKFVLDFGFRNWFKEEYRLALVRIECKSAPSLTDTQASSGKVKES